MAEISASDSGNRYFYFLPAAVYRCVPDHAYSILGGTLSESWLAGCTGAVLCSDRNGKWRKLCLLYTSKIKKWLEDGKMAITMELENEDEEAWMGTYNLLTRCV